MRNATRQKFCKEFGTLEDAYRSVMHIVASQAKRSDGKHAKLNQKSKQRGPILAAFTLGLSLVEIAIMEGYITQACTLVRQELEAIAALQEIQIEKRKDRKVPNVKYLNEVGPLYNWLSGVAHLSDSKALRGIIAYPQPINCNDFPIELSETWGISPKFSPTLIELFKIHIFLTLHFTEFQAIHMEEMHGLKETEDEALHSENTVNLLKNAGVIIFENTSQASSM